MHESKVFYPTLVACSTAVVITACLVSLAAERGAEHKALPDGPRTLENLLREADEQAIGKPQSGEKPVPHQGDWKWEPENAPNQPAKPAPDDQAQPLNRPAAVQAIAPLPVVNIDNLQNLIDRRNNLIDNCNFLTTLKKIVQEEGRLRALQQAVINANNIHQDAQNAANLLNGPGANLMPLAQKEAARNRAAAAWNNVQLANQDVLAQRQVLNPLYKRITPHIGAWLQVYRDMAKFVAPRRNDPNRQAVLQCLEQAVNQRDDFFEGRVLAAYCHAYDGHIKECGGHLQTAIGFIDACAPALNFAQVTYDCAYVCIVADQPDQVKGFITMLAKLPADRQSPSQIWLLASHSVVTKKNNADTAGYFRRALTKLNFFKPPAKGKPAVLIDPMLAGDAAHFFLTSPKAVAKDLATATNLVNCCVGQNNAWQMMRAQAALAAREKNWPAAQQAIAACGVECPLTLKIEVDAETQAYLGNREWIR